jgi:hypothetical protein
LFFTTRSARGTRKTLVRTALAPAVVIVVVLILLAAVAGVYFLITSRSTGSVSSSTFSTGPTSTSSSSTSAAEATTSSSTSTSSTAGGVPFSGVFTFIVPLGPSGINDSSGKPVQWNSTQTASGTFSFTVNPATYIGSGTGQGKITVTTTGYCSGSETVPYNFTITATHAPGEEYEVAFELSTQSDANITVSLSCQGSTAGFYTSNNPVSYIPVYPDLITFAAAPYTDSQPPTEGISYTITVTQESG